LPAGFLRAPERQFNVWKGRFADRGAARGPGSDTDPRIPVDCVVRRAGLYPRWRHPRARRAVPRWRHPRARRAAFPL